MDGKTWFYLFVALIFWFALMLGLVAGYSVCVASEAHERLCYARLDSYYEERL